MAKNRYNVTDLTKNLKAGTKLYNTPRSKSVTAPYNEELFNQQQRPIMYFNTFSSRQLKSRI